MQVEVVGEQFYADNIRQILEWDKEKALDKGGYEIDEIQCTLHHEPKNKYDKNAIAVFVENLQVGHLPKELAADVAPQLRGGFMKKPKIGTATARVWGRLDGKMVRARVTVFL